MGLGGHILQTLKWGSSMFRTRKADLISSGGGRSFLGMLAIAALVGIELGYANPRDLIELSGITLLVTAIDTGTLLSISYVIDPLLGDVFGLFGLRAVLTSLAALALPGWMLSYFRGIRNS